MDDAEALMAAQRALAPNETLIWAEAGPSSPAMLVHILLALVLICVAAGAAWYLFKLWTTFLPGVRTLYKRSSQFLSLAGLALASVVLSGLVILSALAALLNAAKTIGDGAVSYAITDQRAMFVYTIAGAPYIEELTLDILRIERHANDLRFNQPLATNVFGVVYDPVFYDLENAEGVEAMLRRLARNLTGSVAPQVQAAAPESDESALRALVPALYANEQVMWAQHAEGRPYLNLELPRLIIFGAVGALLFAGALWPAPPPDGSDNRGLRLIIGPIGAALTLWAISSAGWVFGSGHVYYALTDQRVVAARTAPWRDVRVFGPSYFDEHAVVEARGDRVQFCRRTGTRRCGESYISGVTNAEAVARLVEDVLQTPPAREPNASPPPPGQ